MNGDRFKYWAFISYSHQDRVWGDWLHRALETYRIPRRLVGRESADGPLPRRLFPVFRDRDELPSSADLNGVINTALRQSRYLIVICSPQSAASRWVNEEIKYFKSLGRADRVLCLIVGGEPDASGRPGSGLLECFPPAVQFVVDEHGALTERRAEPVAADARGDKDGRDNAKLKLIAGLLGVSFDDLRQRERQRRMVQRLVGVAAAIALSLLALGGWRWQQTEKQQALESQALQSRVAQLYQDGRKEFLAHNEARAAVYLNEAYKLGLDTPALRYLLGRAMRIPDAQALRVQTGSLVLNVDIDPSGHRVLSVGANRVLSLWNATTGAKMRDQDLGDMESFTAEFSPMGSLIWVNTRHETAPQRRLRIFDAATGEPLIEFEPDPRTLSNSVSPPVDESDRRVSFVRPDQSIAVVRLDSRRELSIPGRYTVTRFCKDGRSLITGTEDGMVALVDDRTGVVRRHFSGLKGTVVALDSSDDCKTLVAGTAEGVVRVWDTATGETLMTGGHSQAISALHMNAEGTRLMSAARNGINVWDGHTGALIYSGKFKDPISDLATISPDGQRLASLNGTRLAVVDPVSGDELYSLDGHQGPARAFRFGTNNRQVVSGGSDGSLVIWNLPQDLLAELPQNAPQDRTNAESSDPPERVIAFSRSGDSFFTGGMDGGGSLWDGRTFSRLLSLPPGDAPMSAMAFSPDGRLLATGSPNQSVRLWDAATGNLVRAMDHLGAGVFGLAFDSSSRFLSGQIEGGTAKLWDMATGIEVATLERDSSRAQAWSPDGTAYALGTQGVVKLWDMARRQYRWSTALPADEASGNEISVMAYRRDGTSVLAAQQRRKLFVLDAGTGHIIHQITDPAAADLYIGELSPDGRRAVFGDSGKSLRLWQIEENRVLPLLGHTAMVRAASFNPDGTLILSAGEDGLAKIWDSATGELLDSFATHNGAVGWDAARFSPDGQRILTGGMDNVSRLWSVRSESRNPAQVAAELRCRVAWQSVDAGIVSTRPAEQACSP